MTREQQLAHDTLVDFVTTRHEKKMYLLEGYAGTGKTFTISQVVSTLMTSFDGGGYRIAVTAPTHKAVKVLKKFNRMTGVTFSTIHSLLELKESYNEFTGKLKFERSYSEEGDPKINEFDVVLVDEASMLQDELFMHLLEHQDDVRIIFIG